MIRVLCFSLIINCFIIYNLFSQNNIKISIENLQIGDTINISFDYISSLKSNSYKMLLIKKMHYKYLCKELKQDSNKIVWSVTKDTPINKLKVAQRIANDLTKYPTLNPKQQKRINKKYKKYKRKKWFKVEIGFVETRSYYKVNINSITIPENALLGRKTQDKTEMSIEIKGKSENYIINGLLHPKELVFN